VEAFQRIKGATYVATQINMKVAGHVLKNNIIGRTLLPVKFQANDGNSIVMLLEFLIAHVLNGHKAIMGADFLLNESLLAAITPNSIILTKQYKSACIHLADAAEGYHKADKLCAYRGQHQTAGAFIETDQDVLDHAIH
jgi:hypothetical protein